MAARVAYRVGNCCKSSLQSRARARFRMLSSSAARLQLEGDSESRGGDDGAVLQEVWLSVRLIRKEIAL